MSVVLFLCLGLWGLANAQTPAVVEATTAELARAMSSMRIPDQPPPYLVALEVLHGDVATAGAQFGALTSYNHDPYRNLRVEVRVGNYQLDSGNFEGNFGTRDGVVSRALPHDDTIIALRREIWLATDMAYKGATEQRASKIAARKGSDVEHPPDLMRIDPLVTDPIPIPTVDGDRVRQLVTKLSAAIDPDAVEEANAAARDWAGVRWVQSSEGASAWMPTGFSIVRVEGIARAKDGARIRDARWWVARTSDLLPSEDEMLSEVAEMVAWLRSLHTAPVEEDYLGPVLFEPEAAVELFRQLLVPEISGTPPVERSPSGMNDEGVGVPSARMGRRLLPEGWSVVDDPGADATQAGAYTHDFDTAPAQRVVAVVDGVLRDVLMSRVPRLDRNRSTGHGRSLGNERRIAIPASVRVEPNRVRSRTKLRRKALKMARQAGHSYVLVVRRLVPTALTEDFRVAFSGEGPLPGLTAPLEAYRLYPDGTEQPVRGLEFVGVDRRVLRDIAMAGRVEAPVDLMDAGTGADRFSIGVVGGLPVTWAVPSVVIGELELRGRDDREPRSIPMPSH